MLYPLVSILAGVSLCLALAVPAEKALEISKKYGSNDTKLPMFNDHLSIPKSPVLKSVTLRGGDTLNGIDLTFTSGKKVTHGGSGGKPTHLDINTGDYIISANLCWETKYGVTRIVYAQLGTALANQIDAGTKSKDSKNCAIVSAPRRNYGMVGTYGRTTKGGDDSGIAQLGVFWARAQPDN
ncbi:hypothetical protein RSAG8_12317, partial [Rhizoctonia solani AG-8 WAC10335]